MLEKCKISGFADEIAPEMDKQIEVLESLDMHYLEFRSGDGIRVADYTLEQAEALKKKLDAHNIKVSSIGSPIGKIGITDDFEPHFEQYKHVVELAKIFEAPYIRMFSFYIPTGEDRNDYHDEVMRRMTKLVDYAEKENVVLLHENEKGIFGHSVKRCLELMQNFYSDHFKCAFDFANFVQVDEDTEEAFEALKDFIVYIHIKDALYSTHEVVPAGQGDGHVKEILQKLDENGYEGFLSLEPHLVYFSAFRSLEKDGGMQLKKGDGAEAFRTAYRALKDIIG